MCASENKWLKWVSDTKIEGRKCFDCWLLEASLNGTVHPLQLQPYYKQLADWSRVSPSPFSIGAILSLSALSLQPVCKTTQRARHAPASGKCKVCKTGGELLACCFCTALFHNSEACLPQATLSTALAASACFPWACPSCFKKGIAFHPADGAQASRPAAGRRKEEAESEEEAEEGLEPSIAEGCCLAAQV